MPLVLLVDGEAVEAVVRFRDANALRTWFFARESQVRSDQETPRSVAQSIKEYLLKLVHENTTIASSILATQRHLDLEEQVLLVKEAKPEIVADLRRESKDAREQALRQIEPINLKGRSLRGAIFRKALLSRADLRETQLHGANLSGADLQGAELRGAALYGVTEGEDDVGDTSLLDIRGVSWKPLPPDQITRLEKMVANATTIDERRREMVLERLRRAGKPGETPPKWESCLWDEKTAREITCKQQWSTAEIATFRAALHPVLVSLACESTAAAKGFIRQVDQTPDIDPGDSPRWGLTQKLAARINDPLCPGLYTMTSADKDELVILAKRDAEGAPTPQSQDRRR